MLGSLNKPCILLAMLLTALYALAPSANKHLHPSGVTNLPDVSVLRSGDLLLRKGQSFVSGLAARMSIGEQRFSHVGVLVWEAGHLTVIHAVENLDRGFDGVVQQEVRDYLPEATDWAVYRLEMSSTERQAVALKALSFVHNADFTFDRDFDLKTADQLYCSELVWRLLQGTSLAGRVKPKASFINGLFISISDTYRHESATLQAENRTTIRY